MECELVVIGGGISGLTLAWRAVRSGWRVRLLEASHRLGGCIHTYRFPEADGFWLELGAHTVFNSYGLLIDRLREAGLSDAVRKRRPLGYRFWVNGRSESPLRRLNMPRAALGALQMPFRRREGSRVADYYGGLFGARNYRRVIGPALDAVVCQPTADFPAHLLFQRKPRRRDMPRSFTLDHGLGVLVSALAAAPGLEVVTGQAAETVSREPEGFGIRYGAQKAVARSVALAVPAPEAARLLAADFPDLAAPLRGFRPAAIETLGVVAERGAVRLPELAGLIGRDEPFYSLVSRDVVPDDRWRGFAFHFRPGVLGSGDKRVAAGRILGMAPTDFVATVDAGAQLPALRLDDLRRVQDLLVARAEQPIAFAGNWLDGISLEECVARADREFERLARRVAI